MCKEEDTIQCFPTGAMFFHFPCADPKNRWSECASEMPVMFTFSVSCAFANSMQCSICSLAVFCASPYIRCYVKTIIKSNLLFSVVIFLVRISHMLVRRAPPIWKVTQGRDFCTSYWIIIFTIMLMNLDYRVSKWSYEKNKMCFLVKKANKLIQIALFYPGWVRRMPIPNYQIFRAGIWKMGNIVKVCTQIFPAADTSNLHIFQKEFEKIFQ